MFKTKQLAGFCLVAGTLFSGAASSGAAEINLTRPVGASLEPDVLQFNFTDYEGAYVEGARPDLPTASAEEGASGEMPKKVPGPGKDYGDAISFGYGEKGDPSYPNNDLIGQHLKVEGSTSFLHEGESFTVGLWVRVPEGHADDADSEPVRIKNLIGQGGYSDDFPGWGLLLQRSANSAWTLGVRISGVNGNHITGSNYVLVPEFQPGTWHHVGFVYDNEAQTGTFYFDGTAMKPTTLIDGPGESKRPLIIGERGISQHNNLTVEIADVFIANGVHSFVER